MILSLPSFPHVFSGGSTVLTTGEFGLDPIEPLAGREICRADFVFSLEKFEIVTSAHQCWPPRGNSDSLDRSIDLFHVLR